MSDMTGDPTWDGGWEDGVERGDSLEQWILKQSGSFDEEGKKPWGGSTAHEISDLSDPDS